MMPAMYLRHPGPRPDPLRLARGPSSGSLSALLALLLLTASALLALAAPLELRLRSLQEETPGQGDWRISHQTARWDPARTAVVICDMWDQHWCRSATARVAEMAPRMNQVVGALRQRGVLIIHCPSETMDFYRDHPGRQLARNAPRLELQPIKDACRDRVPAAEPRLPIDDSDGGCDDDPPCAQGMPWRRQIAALEIHDRDAITDSAEAYFLMRQRGLTNVIIMGVHQNMCVLGRPFAIRQLVSLGQNVVLMRDLTDSMYNSRKPPFVDHFTGNDLVTWHIEKYWCPTITSDQIVGGSPFRFAADTKPPRVYSAAPQAAQSSQPTLSTLVFGDAFGTGLSPDWSWLRENPDTWRVRDGALEIQVEPGAADTVRNALLLPAPDRSRHRYQIEVTVRNLTPPTQQFEQAGITWYSHGQPVFKLVKELVDGELMILPGRKPMTAERVQLRLTVDASRYVAEFRSNAEGPFQTAATGELPPAASEQVSLQCYHGPANAQHWIAFDDFRIWQLPDE
jgi:nicotinamidase-related amidase